MNRHCLCQVAGIVIQFPVTKKITVAAKTTAELGHRIEATFLRAGEQQPQGVERSCCDHNPVSGVNFALAAMMVEHGHQVTFVRPCD